MKPKAAGSAEGRRLFANTGQPAPEPGSTPPTAAEAGSSHTARYVGAAILVASLAGLAYVWWRRRVA